MIKSMTGYGKADTVINGKKITVEVRSLNSKQLDLSVRAPSAYRSCEYAIRGSATKKLQRGKIEIFLTCEYLDAANTVAVNREAFGDYLRQIRETALYNQTQWESPLTDAAVIPAILRLPEVVRNETPIVPDEETQAVMETADEAFCNLDRFRIQEGEVLIRDMVERIGRIETLKNEVVPYEQKRADAVRCRIREHIESIGIPVDENRLEQEMIYYVEKFDITEEKVRLQNHCDYFRETARSEENAGRKLGFIAQEIGREINTLGSKANDSNIQKLVVQMKDELEKIKEQLLNLL